MLSSADAANSQCTAPPPLLEVRDYERVLAKLSPSNWILGMNALVNVGDGETMSDVNGVECTHTDRSLHAHAWYWMCFFTRHTRKLTRAIGRQRDMDRYHKELIRELTHTCMSTAATRACMFSTRIVSSSTTQLPPSPPQSLVEYDLTFDNGEHEAHSAGNPRISLSFLRAFADVCISKDINARLEPSSTLAMDNTGGAAAEECVVAYREWMTLLCAHGYESPSSSSVTCIECKWTIPSRYMYNTAVCETCR